MGCDIHAYIQYGCFKTREGKRYPAGWQVTMGRNYDLFAILANVRNYAERGEFVPVSEPRGLPKGIGFDSGGGSELAFQIQNDYEEMECDAHSASWLTLAEVELAQQRYSEACVATGGSWFQMRPPEEQAVPPGARVKETVSILGTKEWYVEVGEREPPGPNVDLALIIAAMREMDAQEREPVFVFWFDN